MTTNVSAVANPSVVVVGSLNQQRFDPPGVLLELGSNLFRGYARPVDKAVPSVAVFCCLRGGDPPTYVHRDCMRLSSTVSVYVRGAAQRHADGEDFARAVWFYLHTRWEGQAPEGYTDVRIGESEPEFAGFDDFAHSLWTINLRLLREE